MWPVGITGKLGGASKLVYSEHDRPAVVGQEPPFAVGALGNHSTVRHVNMDGFWFKSTRFAIEPGEDEETNPRIYGRQLAAWLKAQLEQRGYQVEPVIVEDWGHCLMCSRVPFLLWVGCGNVSDLGDRQRSPPDSEDVVWHCFSKAEIPFWRRIFQNMDTSAQLARLNADLDAIFLSEPQIVLVAEP